MNISSHKGFESALEYIREVSQTQTKKGEMFERLMLRYFSEYPVYKDQFCNVWLWKDWAQIHGHSIRDTGIDLVAENYTGGFCAIQCKCYASESRVSKSSVDSFLAAASTSTFSDNVRILVNTGGELSDNLLNTVQGLGDKFRIVYFNDLENSSFNWDDFNIYEPDKLTYKQKKYDMQPHQKQAFDDVINGFNESDRGQMIMPCGTGKTFVSLKIAEQISGINGKVLYLVPSIGLLSQSMQEWSEQRGIDHNYIAVCSDKHAGSTDDHTSIQELKIPVTTDESSITKSLMENDSGKMTVVFCTYHSIHLIEKAQYDGVSKFDIIICDEAHRTTGVDNPGDKTSPFILVHNSERICGNKRLYMTATPKVYSETSIAKVSQQNGDIFSMDDEVKYGKQFHKLTFSEAVDMGKLSDYKVVIFAIPEHEVNKSLSGNTGKYEGSINIDDATKIVGCWRALQNPENKHKDDPTLQPLKRVILFTNRIDQSKALKRYWNEVIDDAVIKLPEDEMPDNFICENEHVDGTVHALNRKFRIDWLKDDIQGVCRILSNARCLSEGIDVPALDGVIFYQSKKSQIDVIQAVGRVMRKSERKDFGYVILPIAIPEGQDVVTALDNNHSFSVVWSVLNALRSHDERLDIQINSIEYNKKLPKSIVIAGSNSEFNESHSNITQLRLLPLNIPVESIIPKIVQKCGDKKYWEHWADDVSYIFHRIVDRINNLLDDPDNDILIKQFKSFYLELINTINTSITFDNAIDMIAQHMITHPVFDALFEGYDFSSRNPVARGLNKLENTFTSFGLDTETKGMKGFYQSVSKRASGLEEGRQQILSDLYEQFFKKALRKESDRLGIAYTPDELVDFVIHSVNDILQDEFGKKLTDENVHILEPFAGTGKFIVRLLESELIENKDLERKYYNELHANEILLLAYYIASINIEEAYRFRINDDINYEPFEGIVLSDTFNISKYNHKIYQQTLLPEQQMEENNERIQRQQNIPIEVIIGNPPWSAWQKSSADDNANVSYPEIENRISETYASRTSSTLKNSLYDTYKMAIRWATDRLQEQKNGIIGFITPASWINGNVDAGIRACLQEEFSSIYILNLLGDARIHGDQGRYQGEGVFGSATQSPVAINILVKNINSNNSDCQIYYRDIGGELNRKEKLKILKDKISVSGFNDWKIINPNNHYDWIDQRSDAFTKFYPMGSKESKSGKTDNAVFVLYSRGLATSRDKYIYNFSHNACADNAMLMTHDYLNALCKINDNLDINIKDVTSQHKTNVQWDRELENKLKRRKKTVFDVEYIRNSAYRPFVKTNCYADYTFVNCKYQQDIIFPDEYTKNLVICVPGKGGGKLFSCIITNTIPDLHFVEASQCFPRWQYPKPTQIQHITSEIQIDRIDNISSVALNTFQEHYNDKSITKDDIFYYVYGILHSPIYKGDFANDLSKMLPHIPYAPDFHGFSQAGKSLAELHLNYENCEQYQGVDVKPIRNQLVWEPKEEDYLLGTKSMKYKDKNTKDVLIINDNVMLTGIPSEAHEYIVNGRTPLEWFINRYKITTDKKSGIVNDANAWFEKPSDLITAIKRIIYVSIESAGIIDNLPDKITNEKT